MSALSRAAVDSHKHARIERGDTVVLSSRIIPGNEKGIYRMIDHLFRREADVIYEDGSNPPVHVSGHASQEEQKLIMNLVKPRYFIPIHGEYRQLRIHADMARSMHGSVGQVLMMESGDVLEFDELGARKIEKVTVGRICIDSGSRTDVVEDLVIKDRRHLSEDGFVLPIIAINKLKGTVESIPEIVMRGFAAGSEEGFVREARRIVAATLDSSTPEEKADYGVVKEKIRADLKRFIVKTTSRRPLIMPVILEFSVKVHAQTKGLHLPVCAGRLVRPVWAPCCCTRSGRIFAPSPCCCAFPIPTPGAWLPASRIIRSRKKMVPRRRRTGRCVTGCYAPQDVKNPGGIVLLHGVHHLGIEDPRLWNLARALAGAGVLVIDAAA